MRIPNRFYHIRLIACLATLPSASLAVAADGPSGEQIYRKQCVACHGALGEGSKEYPHLLVGDKQVEPLAKLIAKTMPEDDPESLTSDEAAKVAAYIYDAFYSRQARDKNKPPRVELSRLTVGQYRNAVADLIGSFRSPGKWGEQHGLRGEYFNARGFQNDKRVIDRIDPEVEFDFGTSGPSADKFDPYQFAIRWEGAVTADETGVYEFIVRSEHAVRLWVNDNRRPLIDAWVKSGSDTEFRASLFLIAGRAYPVRLEFSKAKQGVDDSKNIKEKPKIKASVALCWKQPKRAVEVIPSRNLSPNRFAESFVVTTPFPADDRSLGWVRGTTVSKAWDQAATDAALETAGYVTAHLNELAGTKDGAPDRDAKAREFCRRFAERAFRQPVGEDLRRLFVDRQFAAAKETDAAVKRVVLLVLKSPRFLYREVSEPAGYEVASRLAFALWDAPPDPQLLAAVVDGKLATRAQIAQQAERMLADPRAHAKLREFFLTWLKVDQAPDIAKDLKRFPGFDAGIASDLRTSLELFWEDIAWSEHFDFRRLLLEDEVPMNGRLAKFYGVDLPVNAPFQKVKLDKDQRAGVLTHPFLMAAYAYTGSSSPIHRGVYIARGVLGLSLRPPPDAFTPLAEDLHPKLTTRERVMLQTRDTTCQSCHAIINPLGFTMEHFDAVGRYREKDNGQVVDSTGIYQTRTGETVKFTQVRDLAKFLANSEEVHEAFVEHLFHHLVKQPVRAYGPATLNDLRQYFANNGFNMRKLAIEIAVTASLPPRNRERNGK